MAQGAVEHEVEVTEGGGGGKEVGPRLGGVTGHPHEEQHMEDGGEGPVPVACPGDSVLDSL